MGREVRKVFKIEIGEGVLKCLKIIRGVKSKK